MNHARTSNLAMSLAITWKCARGARDGDLDDRHALPVAKRPGVRGEAPLWMLAGPRVAD
jgi:hypothetical protein